MNHREFFDLLAHQWDDKIDKEDLKRIEKLINEIEIKKGNILDCGCGTGVLYPFLLNKVREDCLIVGMDISHKMLLNAKRKNPSGKWVEADSAFMPFRSTFFDTVIFLNAFPHFVDKEAVLKESFRILKPTGKIYIAHTHPREEVNSFHRNHGGLIANDLIPDDREIISMLKGANFRNIKISERDIFIVSAER